MASNDVTLTIGANLTPAQKKLQAFIQQSQRQLGSQSFAFKLDEKGFRQPLGRITGDLNQFQGAMDASIARTLAFGASVGAIAGVTKAFKDLVGVTVKVEHSLKEINVLLNLSTKDLNSFSKELFGVAKNTASSFDTVTTAATEFSRQGLSAAETAKRVNSALILTRLSGLDAEASVSALTAAVNGFKREAVSTTEVVNRLANVDAAFAVSSGDLAKALSRAGSVSQDAKVKFNELLAATTAVQQATARGGNVIGNGFKTIFTRLQRSKVRSELEKIGVATTDSMGNMRGAISILKDYAKVYQTLSDQQKAYTSEQVAGVFQINTLKALVNDLSNEYGVYNRALAVANATTNEAVKRNEELNKTLQSLASQTGTEIAELAAKVGAISFEGNFKGILGFIKSALGDVNKTIDSEGIGGTLARGVLKGFGDFLSGPGLAVALVGITRLLYFIGKQTKTALAQVFQIGTASQKRQIVQQRINALLMEDGNLLKQIMSSSGNINDITAIVSRNILAQNTALQRQKLLVDQIAAGFALTKSGSIAPIGGVGARRPSGRGAFGRGAQGFVPNMVRSERSSISRGVGGARGGDRPVVIPNFNFGGGKTGTMVAHTGEHIVPNFAAGGSAIFNRNMASSMGLPGGAVRVGAQGFVPNYALPNANIFANLAPGQIGRLKVPGGTVLVGDRTYSAGDFGTTSAAIAKNYPSASATAAAKAAATRKPKKTKKAVKLGPKKDFDIEGNFVGIVSAFDRTKGARDVSIETSKVGKTALRNIKKSRKSTGFATKSGKDGKGTAPPFDRINFKGIQVSNITAFKGTLEEQEASFRKDIADLFVEPLGEFASRLMKTAFDGDEFKKIKTKLTTEGRNPEVFSSQAEGAIFEAAIDLGVKKAKSIKDFVSKRPATFDFEETQVASDDFKEAFKFENKGALKKADAKRTANTESLKSIVGKSFNDKKMRQKLKGQFITQFPVANYPNPGTMAAEGFIPSFANLASIAASPAGKRAMATERALAGSSRMGYDSRVGYGVYNNSQGSLSNAVSQHMNAGDSATSLASTGAAAQGVSAAEGYVPNYTSPFALGSALNPAATRVVSKGIVNAIVRAFSKGTKVFKEGAGKMFKKGSGNFDSTVSKILLASYSLNTAAGMAQQGLLKAEKDLLAAKVGGGMTGFTTGMTAGALMPFIPGGAVIGGVVGAITGLVLASNGIEKALVGIAQERVQVMETASKDQGDIVGYLQKVDKLKAATTGREMGDAQRELARHLATMDPAVAANVKALGTNTSAIHDLALEMKREAEDKAGALTLEGARASEKTVKELVDARTTGYGDMGMGMGGLGLTAKEKSKTRRLIEEEGAEALAIRTQKGREIGNLVKLKDLDTKDVREMRMLFQNITALEFPEEKSLTPHPKESQGAFYDPFKGLEHLKDKTVGEYLTKDLGLETIPEELKAVLDKTIGELNQGYTLMSENSPVNTKSREALQILSGVGKNIDADLEAWGKRAPARAQKAADEQAEALRKRLESLEIDPSKIFGSVLREEGRRVARDSATAAYQGKLGGLGKLSISDIPDTVMGKQTKADRVSDIERKAISRGKEVALDKQKVKYLTEIAKAMGEDDVEDGQLAALEDIKDQLIEGKDADKILAEVIEKHEGEALEALKDQVATLKAIETAANRQAELLKLNGLRQAALLEEARRQTVKDAIAGGATDIKKKGHQLRSQFFAIEMSGGKGQPGQAFGPNLGRQQGVLKAFEDAAAQVKGLVTADFFKENYTDKITSLKESIVGQGRITALAPNLLKDIRAERGEDVFKNMDDLLAAALGPLRDIRTAAEGGQLSDVEGFKRLFADRGIPPEIQERMFRTLINMLENMQSVRGENKQRAAFEKAFAEANKAALAAQDRTSMSDPNRMGISAQMGTKTLDGMMKVINARIESTQGLIDTAKGLLGKDDPKGLEKIKYDIIAALKQIPGVSDEFIEKAKGKEVPELLEFLQTFQKSQRDQKGEIVGTMDEIAKNFENVKRNSDALETTKGSLDKLTIAINELKGKILNLMPTTEPKKDTSFGGGLPRGGAKPVAPTSARGFIPSLAVGGAADAMGRERRAILGGVGGAIPGVDTARMVNLNGRPAAINTGEKLVNNYKGTGQTAVLNRNMRQSGMYARGYIPNMATGGRSPWWNLTTPTQPKLGVTTDDPKEFADQMQRWNQYLELTVGAKTGTPDIDAGLPVGPLKRTPPRKSITVSNIQGAPPQVRGGGQPYSPRARPAPAPALPVKRIDDAMPSVDPSREGKGFDAPRTRGFTDSVVQAPEGEPYYGIAGYRGGPDPSYIEKGMEPIYGKGDFEGSVKGKIIGSRPIGSTSASALGGSWNRPGRQPVYGEGGTIIGSKPLRGDQPPSNLYARDGTITGPRDHAADHGVGKGKRLPDIRDRDMSGMAARGYIPNMAGGATEAQLAEMRAEADSVFKMLTQSMLRAGTLSQAELNAIPLPSKGADWELGDLRGGARFYGPRARSSKEGKLEFARRSITLDRSKFTNSNLTRLMGNELYHYISSFQKGGKYSIATSKAMFEPEMWEDGDGYRRAVKMKEMDPKHIEAVKRHILNQERSTRVAYEMMTDADKERFTLMHGNTGFDMGGIYGESSGTVGKSSTRFKEANMNLLMIRAMEAEEEASTAHDTMMNDQSMQFKYEMKMKELAKATAQPTAPPVGAPPVGAPPVGAPPPAPPKKPKLPWWLDEETGGEPLLPFSPERDQPKPPPRKRPRKRPTERPRRQGKLFGLSVDVLDSGPWATSKERAGANARRHNKNIANMRKKAAGLGGQMGSRQSQFRRGGRRFNRMPSQFNAEGYIPNMAQGFGPELFLDSPPKKKSGFEGVINGKAGFPAELLPPPTKKSGFEGVINGKAGFPPELLPPKKKSGIPNMADGYIPNYPGGYGPAGGRPPASPRDEIDDSERKPYRGWWDRYNLAIRGREWGQADRAQEAIEKELKSKKGEDKRRSDGGFVSAEHQRATKLRELESFVAARLADYKAEEADVSPYEGDYGLSVPRRDYWEGSYEQIRNNMIEEWNYGSADFWPSREKGDPYLLGSEGFDHLINTSDRFSWVAGARADRQAAKEFNQTHLAIYHAEAQRWDKEGRGRVRPEDKDLSYEELMKERYSRGIKTMEQLEAEGAAQDVIQRVTSLLLPGLGLGGGEPLYPSMEAAELDRVENDPRKFAPPMSDAAKKLDLVENDPRKFAPPQIKPPIAQPTAQPTARPMGRGTLFGAGVDVLDSGPWATSKERAEANARRHNKNIANMRKKAAGLGGQMGSRQSKFGRGGGWKYNAEGYIPNLSSGSEMVPNMSASNHFLNFAEGSVPAAATSSPPETSLAAAQTPGDALITRAKSSQEKHNVNVNIEVYGNLSQDKLDEVQSNGSDVATLLEELVNGGL